jgi:predicted phage terminase large subunit-like protein
MMPSYRPEPFHALVCETLERVVSGEIRKVMLFAPPQHGKSQIASVMFPAFYAGVLPDNPMIITSYAASLAEDKSRQVREIVTGSDYQEVFPGIALKEDSKAVGLWKIAGHRGQMLAVGVGGAITGHPGLLGLIDDPFENWKSSQSQTIREDVWNWYQTTFRTRIWEGGAIILIMTRWHEFDLAGMILNSPGAEEWTVLRLPALAESQQIRDKNNLACAIPAGLPDPLDREEGEPLTPKRFSLKYMLELKRDVGTLAWNAEYQGAPRAPEGNRIKRSWFDIVEDIPSGPHIYRIRAWDKAATARSEDKNADYTAGVLIAYDELYDLFYIEDIFHGQWGIKERDDEIDRAALKDYVLYGSGMVVTNPVIIWHEQEPGASGKQAALAMNARLRQYPVFCEVSSGSKQVRAEPFIAAAEGRRVKIKRARWNDEYLNELADFPNGAHDDMIDATSLGYNKLILRVKKKLMRVY